MNYSVLAKKKALFDHFFGHFSKKKSGKKRKKRDFFCDLFLQK